MQPTRIEVLTLGSELLIGLQVNYHLAYLGEQLARRGLKIQRSVVADDDEAEIVREFRESWKRADIVIITGGLGATADDITRECIAHAIGLELVHDPEIERAVEAYFERRNRPMPDINRKIALRPANAMVLPNRIGTAPGLCIEMSGKIAFLLPGPSTEMRDIFDTEVLPRLEKNGMLGFKEEYVQLRTAGIGESSLAEKLRPILETEPGITAAYCIHDGIVDCRLSAKNGDVAREKIDEAARVCARHLGEDFVCFGRQGLDHVVFEMLRERELTLAVAESCTGGLLSNSFTNIAGASKVFLGGCVCYGNDAKIEILDIPECFVNQHGAVSSEIAIAMASGVADKLGSDYALSVTGFAGPGGGTASDPVGTVYIGLDTPEGGWCLKEHFFGGRLTVKKLAVAKALDWLRRELLKTSAPARAQETATRQGR